MELYLGFILASILLSLSPGPDNLYVLSQSALFGKSSGIAITLGLCTGLVVHTLIVALGIAVLLQESTVLLNSIQILGGLYLLYLAWQAFRSAKQQLQINTVDSLPLWSLYRRGIVMNVSNPKVSIFFLAFLPQFIDVEMETIGLQIIMLGSIFILCAFLVFSAIALLASQLGPILQSEPVLQTGLHIISGMVFLVLALHLIVSSLLI